MANFCSKCGSEVKGKFCGKCGNQMDINEVITYPQKDLSGKKKKKRTIIVVSIIGVIILLVSIFGFTSCDRRPAYEKDIDKKFDISTIARRTAYFAKNNATCETYLLLGGNISELDSESQKIHQVLSKYNLNAKDKSTMLYQLKTAFQKTSSDSQAEKLNKELGLIDKKYTYTKQEYLDMIDKAQEYLDSY